MGNGINDLPLYLRPQTVPVTANKPDDVEEPAENTESNGVRAFSPIVANEPENEVNNEIEASKALKEKVDEVLSRWHNGEITMPSEMLDELKSIGITTDFDENTGIISFNISLFDINGNSYQKYYKLKFKTPSNNFFEKRLGYIISDPTSVDSKTFKELLEYCKIKYKQSGNTFTFKIEDRNYTVEFKDVDAYGEKANITIVTDLELLKDKVIDKNKLDEIVNNFVKDNYLVPDDLKNDLRSLNLDLSITSGENGATIITFEAVFESNGKIITKSYKLTFKKPTEAKQEKILENIINNKDNYSQADIEKLLKYWGIEPIKNGDNKIEFETTLHKYSFEFDSDGNITSSLRTQSEAQEKLEKLKADIKALTDRFEKGEITANELKTELEKLGEVTDFKSETKNNVLTVTCKVNGVKVSTSRKVESASTTTTEPAENKEPVAAVEPNEYKKEELSVLGFTEEEISILFQRNIEELVLDKMKEKAKETIRRLMLDLRLQLKPDENYPLADNDAMGILLDIFSSLFNAENANEIYRAIDNFEHAADLREAMDKMFDLLLSSKGVVGRDRVNINRRYKEWNKSLTDFAPDSITYSFVGVDSSVFADFVGSDEDKKQELLTKILKLYYPDRDFIPGEEENFESIIIEDKSSEIMKGLEDYCHDKKLARHKQFIVQRTIIITKENDFFYRDVKSELEKKYAGELIVLGLMTNQQELRNLFNLALFNTLSDNSVKNAKEISLSNFTEKLLKNYFDILKDMKNESTRNYVRNWHNLYGNDKEDILNINERIRNGNEHIRNGNEHIRNVNEVEKIY